MRVKKLLAYFLSFAMFFGLIQFKNDCQALSISEKYYSCFEECGSPDVVIKKTTEEDKEILRTMILSEGSDFTRYLGYGGESSDPDELLRMTEDELCLTVKNSDNNVIGQILISKGSNANQLKVTYWIGNEFRGNGYAHLAVSKAMSKIWESDKSVSFEFEIDDENTASIRTLEKICGNINIDFKNPESGRFISKSTHIVEIKANKVADENSNYNVQCYVDSILLESNTIAKEKLLENYSENKLESGILMKVSSSIYLIKYSG